jgi:hypothetical protein
MQRYNVTLRRTHPSPEAEAHIRIEDAKGAWDALRLALTKARKIENFVGVEPEDIFAWIVPVTPEKPKVLTQDTLFEDRPLCIPMSGA